MHQYTRTSKIVLSIHFLSRLRYSRIVCASPQMKRWHFISFFQGRESLTWRTKNIMSIIIGQIDPIINSVTFDNTREG